MPTRPKVKIHDDPGLRETLDALYHTAAQPTLAKWAIHLAKHIMQIAAFPTPDHPVIQDGFRTNEAWQTGQARMHDVRQAGFAVHALAKASPHELDRTVLRVVGQAVGTGHMPEHAMVASDYAVKAINLLYPGDASAVTAERRWQIDSLKSYCDES